MYKCNNNNDIFDFVKMMDYNIYNNFPFNNYYSNIKQKKYNFD